MCRYDIYNLALLHTALHCSWIVAPRANNTGSVGGNARLRFRVSSSFQQRQSPFSGSLGHISLVRSLWWTGINGCLWLDVVQKQQKADTCQKSNGGSGRRGGITFGSHSGQPQLRQEEATTPHTYAAQYVGISAVSAIPGKPGPIGGVNCPALFFSLELSKKRPLLLVGAAAGGLLGFCIGGIALIIHF